MPALNTRSFNDVLEQDGAGPGGGSGAAVYDAGFGDIASYAVCGCCGHFHSAFDGELGALIGNDRGGAGGNGKVSFDPFEAGAQLSRANLSWSTGGLGQAGTVTFAFRSTAPATLPGETAGFSRFTDTQVAATLLAMASWSDVANITFQRVDDEALPSGYSNNATILLGNYSSGANGSAAFAYLPNQRGVTSNSGDVWINNSLNYNATPVPLGYGQQVLVHELGHSIGLLHPAPYNASEGVSITYGNDAIYFEDSRQYTVMSYFSERNTGGDNVVAGTQRYSAVPLLDDIAAAQRLYGANTTTRTGDTIYGFNSNADRPWFQAISSASTLIFAVWDAAGNDTFDFSGYNQNQTIDLRQGGFSSVGGLRANVSIAVGASIENAIGGSGNDEIMGNSGNNILTGGAGNDVLDGGLGIDTANFSGAFAAYTISWNGQVATVTGPDGTDTLTNIEFLQFSDQRIAATPSGGLRVGGDITNNTIQGTNFADVIGGLGGNDVLNGLGGDDMLDGGSGNDVLNGGDGNDILIGGLGDDVLDGGNGIDEADYSGAGARVTVDLTAGTSSGGAGVDRLSNIENLRGSVFADTLIGNAQANVIFGGGGSDTLRGMAGNDTLVAGAAGLGGGAPDIVKASTTANATIGTAINLDGGFDLLPRSDVGNSATIPHATVVATSHGGLEYYGFTVGANSQVVFDIDAAGFDTVIRIFDAAGTEIAFNDDGGTDNSGATDSGLTYTFAAGGAYYVQVSQWISNNADDTVVSGPPPAGAPYTLHVSVPGHAVAPTFLLGSTLDGGLGDDVLIGSEGADTFIGGSGNDRLDGGDGFDSALYSGVARQYGFSGTNDGGGNFTSRVTGGPEGGTDTLNRIEQAVFIDGVRTFDVNSAAAQVMRLYNAALNRVPDQDGLEFLESGVSRGQITILDLATSFFNSAEFQARFGSLTNQQFVEQLYRFTLGREGDAQGIQTWINAIELAGFTRGRVLLEFSESPEHRALTAGTLAQGLFVADPEALIIARLYDATYDRLPDVGGLEVWKNALEGGMSLTSIAAAFATAPEFQARYGNLTDRQFVEQLYRFTLDREGESAGVQGWINELANGLSRAELLLAFSESGEHVALTRPLFLGGIRFEGYVEGAAIGAEDQPRFDIGLGDDATGPAAKTFDDGPQTTPVISLDDLGFGNLLDTAGRTDDFALTLPSNPDVSVFKADLYNDAFVLPVVNDDQPLVLPGEALDGALDDGPQLTLDPQLQIEISARYGPMLIDDFADHSGWSDHRHHDHFGG